MLIKKKDNSYLIESSKGIEILYNRYLVPDLLKCCNYLFTYWLHLPEILFEVFVSIYRAAHAKISETYTLQVFWATRPWPAGSTTSNQCTACSWQCSRLESSRFFEFLMNFPPKQIATQFFFSSVSQELFNQVNLYVIALYIANAYLL